MGRIEVCHNSESGMTLLEVMVAGLVMSLSLMALAMTMVQGLAAMVIVEEQLIAKQKAREVLESVFTARSTQNLAFTDIESLSGGGIFLEGWQPIRGMGVDGIANTADDSATPIESIPLPGADGVWLTADDEMRVLDTFERRIVFSPVLMPSSTVDQEIRNVTVDVRFLSHGSWWTVSVSSYISRFA